MKNRKTGVISGCVVWVIVFGILASCLVTVAMMAGGFTSATGFAVDVVGPLVCPEETTPRIRSYATTSRDDFGNDVPATGYEMQCLNDGGEIVKTDPVLFAFLWIGILAVAGIILSAILAVFLAAPAGLLIARLFKPKDPASMNIEPR
ncbi:MAG: hypothetical protein C4583_08265 [Anaerolineaceae bacterium]|nr:MAG: hypothetical protein C4583_08265 [Anaerolineaceae bacterium]